MHYTGSIPLKTFTNRVRLPVSPWFLQGTTIRTFLVEHGTSIEVHQQIPQTRKLLLKISGVSSLCPLHTLLFTAHHKPNPNQHVTSQQRTLPRKSLYPVAELSSAPLENPIDLICAFVCCTICTRMDLPFPAMYIT